MNFNCCLSLSRFLLLVQYCESMLFFSIISISNSFHKSLLYFCSLTSFSYSTAPCVVFLFFWTTLPSNVPLYTLHHPHCPIFVCHCLLNPAFIPLSHPFMSLKALSSASKHTLTGWGSRARWPSPVWRHACSAWSRFLSMALCSWLSTLSFRWPTFVPRTSWIKTFSIGIVTKNQHNSNTLLEINRSYRLIIFCHIITGELFKFFLSVIKSRLK